MAVAIVTGGTSGLGAAIAGLLDARGDAVVTVSRRPSATVSGDGSRTETVQRAITEAEKLGPITLLVNCAGTGVFGAAGSYDEEKVRSVAGDVRERCAGRRAPRNADHRHALREEVGDGPAESGGGARHNRSHGTSVRFAACRSS